MVLTETRNEFEVAGWWTIRPEGKRREPSDSLQRLSQSILRRFRGPDEKR